MASARRAVASPMTHGVDYENDVGAFQLTEQPRAQPIPWYPSYLFRDNRLASVLNSRLFYKVVARDARDRTALSL